MIKPMLAYKLNQHKINFKEFIYMQPKLDGVRCLFTKDGAFSRTGKQFMNVKHIEESLKDYFEQNPAMVLDGELYNHNLRNDFEKIISLVRKQKPTDEDRSEARKLTQYHVYDYTNTSMSNMVNYKYRLNQLTCSDIYTSSIHYVESRRVKSMKQAKDFHIRKLAEGYEGSILRTNTPYKHGRSWGLMKFKDFHDAEATIVDYQEGKGKRLGTIGKFIMQDDDGNVFGCPPGKGYNYSDMKCILENIHKYMGQKATFTYFERTKAGSYRHPLFKTLRNYE
jgi:DNA ligase-1|tara:strand:+ start:321 stop:1160 length:840 start_codon:yes stop_codon:yes gene_type:complete